MTQEVAKAKENGSHQALVDFIKGKEAEIINLIKADRNISLAEAASGKSGDMVAWLAWQISHSTGFKDAQLFDFVGHGVPGQIDYHVLGVQTADGWTIIDGVVWLVLPDHKGILIKGPYASTN